MRPTLLSWLTPLETVDDYIAGGRAMQRFWLEATRQGLRFQPEMTPLIFSRYVTQSLDFTGEIGEREVADGVAAELDALLGKGENALSRVYMGRVGFGPEPTSRSVRPALDKLLIVPSD